MRIGVIGLKGRVGSLLSTEIERLGASFVGGTTRSGAPSAIDAIVELPALAEVADAVIDFSSATAIAGTAATLAAAGTAWVLGTTGIDDDGRAAIERAASRIAIVKSANFAPGANVVMRIAHALGAALAADDYDAEILETHHRGKRDAPSGTALAIGRAVASGRGVAFERVRLDARDGMSEPRQSGGIGFAALRAGAVVGEHALSFTSSTEQVTLVHRAFDRRVFAEGAVRAALWVAGRPPGLYGMDDVLAPPAG